MVVKMYIYIYLMCICKKSICKIVNIPTYDEILCVSGSFKTFVSTNFNEKVPLMK